MKTKTILPFIILSFLLSCTSDDKANEPVISHKEMSTTSINEEKISIAYILDSFRQQEPLSSQYIREMLHSVFPDSASANNFSWEIEETSNMLELTFSNNQTIKLNLRAKTDSALLFLSGDYFFYFDLHHKLRLLLESEAIGASPSSGNNMRFYLLNDHLQPFLSCSATIDDLEHIRKIKTYQSDKFSEKDFSIHLHNYLASNISDLVQLRGEYYKLCKDQGIKNPEEILLGKRFWIDRARK